MFLERFKEVENFTITKLPLGGSKSIWPLIKVWRPEQKNRPAAFRLFQPTGGTRIRASKC